MCEKFLCINVIRSHKLLENNKPLGLAQAPSPNPKHMIRSKQYNTSKMLLEQSLISVDAVLR